MTIYPRCFRLCATGGHAICVLALINLINLMPGIAVAQSPSLATRDGRWANALSLGVDPASDVVIDAVDVDDSSGKRRVRFRARTNIGQSLRVFWLLDMNRKTYRLFALGADPDSDASRIYGALVGRGQVASFEQIRSDLRALLKARRAQRRSDAHEGDVHQMASTSGTDCQYRASGSLASYDPLVIMLTKVALYAHLWDPMNNDVYGSMSGTNCWANRDTGMSTWYVSQCSISGASTIGGSGYSGVVYGQFYNTDFGFPGWRTTSGSHVLFIFNREQPVYWDSSYEDGGELSTMIYAGTLESDFDQVMCY